MTIYISNGVYITNIILALQRDRLSPFAAKTTVVFPFLLPKEQTLPLPQKQPVTTQAAPRH